MPSDEAVKLYATLNTLEELVQRVEKATDRLQCAQQASDRAAMKIMEHPRLSDGDKHDLLSAVRIQYNWTKSALRWLEIERTQ